MPPTTQARDRHGRLGRRGLVRAPAAAAAAVAAIMYALLPNTLLVGPRLVIPALELALIAAVMVTDPTRSDRHSRWSRRLSLATALVIAATDLVSLGLLVHQLLLSHNSQGQLLLLAAGQVWLTNVIAFACAFWELDRGGPVARIRSPRSALEPADFRFTQDEDADDVDEVRASASLISGWMPSFVDYLYVSLTNSSAFSPTDTMPLSARAKILMGVESTAALVTTLLVVAKGVSGLSS